MIQQSPLALAVMASGHGTNFQAILDAVDRRDLEIDIRLCLSDREGAGALDRARAHGIPTAVIHPKSHADDETYARNLLRLLNDYGCNFIALAGYLKRIPTEVVSSFRGRIVNIHPALLPAFGGHGMYGRRVHEAVIEYGVHWTGATVHVVDEEYDTGPIVLQEPVPVYADDTAESVAARVLDVEHRIYPEALRLFSQGRVSIDGRRVRILQPQESEKASAEY
ncbi:MAG: phosphoribosylglycinamide formyltransferase [Rhodothermales bacterium]